MGTEGEPGTRERRKASSEGRGMGRGRALPEPLVLQHELLQHPVEVPLSPGHPGPNESRGCREEGGSWSPRSPRPYPHLAPPPGSSYLWGPFGPVGTAGDGSPPGAAIAQSPNAGVALPQGTAEKQTQSYCCGCKHSRCARAPGLQSEWSLKCSPGSTCQP